MDGLDACSMCGKLFEYDKLMKHAGASGYVCFDCAWRLNKIRGQKDGMRGFSESNGN